MAGDHYRSAGGIPHLVPHFMTPEAVQELLFSVYPQTRDRFCVESLDRHAQSLRMRMQIADTDLRPGDTISGPSMFTLADCAFYALVMGLKEGQVQAVTTNLNINFMRRPEKRDLWAEARMLKLGRRLAVGDVLIRSADRVVAQASVTYSLIS